MRLKLPIITSAADYASHFDDDVWQQTAELICVRHNIHYRSLRRSQQGENIVFFVDQTRVIKIFAPFRENYSRETSSHAFACGKLGIETAELLHVGEIEGWSYLVMTQLEGQASGAVWAAVPRHDRLEIVSHLGVAMRELHAHRAPLQTRLD